MDISTTFGPHDVLLLGDAQPVLGTAVLGDDFGVIRRATLVRTGRREEVIDDAQSLRILLINNPGFEVELEACFDVDVEAPGLLEVVELPLLGVFGRVMEGSMVMWEEGGERMLRLPVAQWDSMEPDHIAYRLTPDGETLPISLSMDYEGGLITADGDWPTADSE